MRALLILIFLVMGVVVVGGARNGSSRPRVVNVGALFTFNSVIGRAVKPAIQAAIDDVNSESSVLPGTQLNLIFHDTNCSGFLGTMEDPLMIVGACMQKNFCLLMEDCCLCLILRSGMLVGDRHRSEIVSAKYWGLIFVDCMCDSFKELGQQNLQESGGWSSGSRGEEAEQLRHNTHGGGRNGRKG